MLWIVILLIALMIEFLTVSLISIWFAFGSGVALALWACDVPLVLQVIAFFVVSIATLFLTKPYTDKRLLPKDKIIKTNVDSLIGEKAVVTIEISPLNGTGEVLLEGKMWTARAVNDETIPVSTTVIVEKIEGVKVIVTPLKEEKGE